MRRARSQVKTWGLVLEVMGTLLGAGLLNGEEASPPSPAVDVGSGQEAAELVTLDYRDADLSNVLRSFAYAYHLNLVTSSDVKGKVTVSLKDVTIEDALEAILTANGLTYSRRGQIIYINPGAQEGVAIVAEPVRLSYLKAVDAQTLVRKILSPKGDIKVDEVSNTLVIADFPGTIQRVRELLKHLDVAPQQVLIEAKILDITSKDLQNLGLTLTSDWKPSGNAKGIFHRDTSFQEQLKSTLTVAGSSSTLSSGQLKLDALTFKGLSLTATIDALVRDQKAHLLASPSIAVLNNQEARIVIGEKVPFKERTQTTTGTTETTKFIDVGTTLRVTPSLNADGYITMRIHPEVSSVAALLDAGPRITTREADTTVRIKEGETIVIAGLITQEDNRTKSHVPILGQLPGLEYVFGSRSRDHTQTELAVFITPRMVRSREEQEALGREAVKKEEATVTLPTTGQLGIVLALFQKADHLERGQGLESRRKPPWFRAAQALNLYEHIVAEFPQSPQVPEALYRIARIQATTLRDFEQARVSLQQLQQEYPNSPAASKVQELLRDIERQERLSRLSLDLERAVVEEKWAQQRHEQMEQARLAREHQQQRQQQEATQQRVAERSRQAQERAEVLRRRAESQAAQANADQLRKQHAQLAQRQRDRERAEAQRQHAFEQARQAKAERLRAKQERAEVLWRAQALRRHERDTVGIATATPPTPEEPLTQTASSEE